jgi:hypothetical protein
MFQLSSCLCALVGKWRNEKYIFSLSMKLVKVGSYDFPQPLGTISPFQQPLIHIEFDIPGVE